jgi:hypothetical protein
VHGNLYFLTGLHGNRHIFCWSAWKSSCFAGVPKL